MFDPITHQGVWFTPSKPDEKVSGILEFDQDEGGTLALSGVFGIPRLAGFQQGPEVILGVSDTGKAITLYGCTQTRSTVPMSGLAPPKSTYHVGFVVEGGHFEEASDLALESLAVQLSNLNEWVGSAGLDVQHALQPFEVTVHYRRPDPIPLGSIDGIQLSLGWGCSISGDGVFQNKVTVMHDAHFGLDADGSRPLTEWVRLVRRLQDFFTIAMAEPAYPIAINVVHGQPKTLLNVVYQLPKAPARPKALIPTDMLFRFPDVREDLATKLANWFGKGEVLDPVYALYFGTLYNPLAYQEQRFLAFAQALESYHRRTRDRPTFGPDEFAVLREQMVSAVGPERREWALAKTRYLNEQTFRQRLRDLVDLFTPITDRLPVERGQLVNAVVATRNYYTHYSDDALVARGASLYRLTQQLRVLLAACLLYEIGFSVVDIDRLVAGNRTYRFDLTGRAD